MLTGYNGHMHDMCLRWDHTHVCSMICMTIGLHVRAYHQYCTCMHIFDQHCMNGEADNSRFVNMHLPFKESIEIDKDIYITMHFGVNKD